MATTKLTINNNVKTFIFNQKPVDNAWVFEVFALDAFRDKECQYEVALQPYNNEYLPVFVPTMDKENLPEWVFVDENIIKVSNEIKRLYTIPK